MLDVRFLVEHADEVKEILSHRSGTYDVDKVVRLDADRKAVLGKVEALKARRNQVSKQIAVMKKSGENTDALVAEMKADGETIRALDAQCAEIEVALKDAVLAIPNLPHASVPIGKDDSENEIVRTWGKPTEFGFAPKAHWDIGQRLGYFDFDRAAKVSGPRFTFYLGAFARLERSLAALMLDIHAANGYTEVLPPYMVNTASLTGSGQLPKFADQAYNTNPGDFWMIPTAEVPVTNYYRDEILSAEDLPKWFCAYSSCFRAEAGAAGRDTRGIIRQHQFQKVELVKYCLPENSFAELESLTEEAERILELLKLPYRRVCLSTGDVGFSSAKTYDLEVWMPSYNDYEEKDGLFVPTTKNYKEISSCSNDTDYQARRMNIRFKRTKDSKTEYVHMLNGSGLAVGRTVAAVIENYQNEDGSITVPEVLRPYMGCDIIK